MTALLEYVSRRELCTSYVTELKLRNKDLDPLLQKQIQTVTHLIFCRSCMEWEVL